MLEHVMTWQLVNDPKKTENEKEGEGENEDQLLILEVTDHPVMYYWSHGQTSVP